ncbi:MAG: aldo/keto reductase [Candidatus Omnitrophica bacterium]|nr:aldo/keto reductase [Candidatus Omnitrophota bacterium]
MPKIQYRKLGSSNIKVTTLALGTWAFGADRWWGEQRDLDSQNTLYRAIELGINFIDTAPIYGNGHSEAVIGEALKKEKLREKVILATKAGLRWKASSPEESFYNLKKQSILEEVEDSLRRLQTEVIDLYQAHFPDHSTPIGETAQALYKLYQKGKIRAIGVSNFSVGQMREFMKFSALHSLQPRYSMFRREIESEILPFCIENNIAVLAYSPLDNAVLTGKFFFGQKIPQDKVRSINYDLEGENFRINKEAVVKLKDVASKYKKSLTQLALNWVVARRGLTCAIVGARRPAQIEENTGAAGWEIAKEDMENIESILGEREERIKKPLV